jgi:aminopeptidase N
VDNELRVVADMAYQRTGKGLHFFRDPTDDAVYLHSQFEPFDAHLVYPCFDQPDLKAVFDLSVDAPADWVVVSNAACLERPADGAAGRWHFAPTPRLSPYVTAVVAGAYVSVHDRHGDVDLGLYVRRSLRDHLEEEELFDLTRRGLDWFNANFGITYPLGSTTNCSFRSSPRVRWRTLAA